MTLPAAVLLLVALQRAAELAFAVRNTRQLRALGAIETDRRGYPWFVVLHGAWLASLWLAVPADAAASWPLLGLYGALQLARLWSIASLGRYWTTRILTLPGAPLVAAGPYRWLRHPNYLIVTAEIAVLPLAFGALALAVVFSAANFVLLARRIAIEERALAPRRQGAVDMPTTIILQSPDVLPSPTTSQLDAPRRRGAACWSGSCGRWL